MVDPSGSGQFAIGFGDDDTLDAIDAQLEQVDRDIQEFLTIKSGVDEAISSYIDLAIRENQDLTSTVNGVIAGRVDRAIEEMATITGRLQSRSENQIDRRIELQSSYVGNLLENVPPPTEVTQIISGPTSVRPSPGDFALEPTDVGAPPPVFGSVTCPPGYFPDPLGSGKCFPITTPPGNGGGGGGQCDPFGFGVNWYRNDPLPGGPAWNKISQDKNFTGPFNYGDPGVISPASLPNYSVLIECSSTSPPTSPDQTPSNCIPICGISPGTGPTCPPCDGKPTDTTTTNGWGPEPDIKLPGCAPAKSTPGGDGATLTVNQALLQSVGQASQFGSLQLGEFGFGQQTGFLPEIDAALGLQPPTSEQGQAPVPEPIAGQCAPPQSGDFIFIALCGPDNWEAAKAGLAELSSFEGATSEQIFSTANAQLSQQMNAIQADGIIASALKWGFVFLLTGAISAFGVLTSVILSIVPIPKACQNVATASLFAYSAVIRFAQRWLNIIPPSIYRGVEQATNYTCQTEIPSTQELTLQRMVGVISKDEWDYGAKLNGCCPAWFEKSYEAGLLVPTVPQTFALWRGQFITDEQFRYWLKRNRIPEDTDAEMWDKLTQALPGPSELMRMMVRDVEDQTVVDENNLDHLFADKWKGQLRDWGLRQGLTDDVAKYDWRAHWETVSNTALLQMYYRLRAGEPISTFGGEDISVDEKWLEKQLLINDMIPGQAKRFIATSRPVFAVTYLRMLYVTGVLTEEELIPRFQDLGYTLDDSRKFAKGLAKSQNQLKARYNGLYEPQRARNDFIKNLINEAAYRIVLLDAGYVADEVEQRVKSAKMEQQALANKGLLAQAKSAFFRGRLSADEYRQVLLDIGLEGDQLDTIYRRNVAEREWKYTEISIRRMCGLVKTGHLSVAEYVRRAKNLGFRETDAILQASSCVAEIQEQQQRRIAAELKAALQEAARNERRERRIASAECKLLRKQQRASANPTEANIVAAQLQACENINVGP